MPNFQDFDSISKSLIILCLKCWWIFEISRFFVISLCLFSTIEKRLLNSSVSRTFENARTNVVDWFRTDCNLILTMRLTRNHVFTFVKFWINLTRFTLEIPKLSKVTSGALIWRKPWNRNSFCETFILYGCFTNNSAFEEEKYHNLFRILSFTRVERISQRGH